MIDDENYDKMIEIQQALIKKTNKTVSFARVANLAFIEGLKSKKRLIANE